MEEKLERSEVWSRLLFRLVPESQLQLCFDRAFQDHKSAFPITAYDLKDTWDRIVEEGKPLIRALEFRIRNADAILKITSLDAAMRETQARLRRQWREELQAKREFLNLEGDE